MLAGHWEPLLFRRRAGFAAADEEAIYGREHAAETLRHLRRAGINLLITHFHKGFGPEAEAAEIDRARSLVREAHSLGLRLGAYIRFDALAMETMAREDPAAVDWVQRDAQGETSTYRGQEFRLRLCPAQGLWLRRLQSLLRLAVAIGFDLIHLDGFTWGTATPCHCPACAAGFQAFLSARYPDAAARVERFGHAQVQALEIPRAAALEEAVVRDPVRQEWLDFRVATLAAVHRRLAETVKALSPEVAITCNTLVPTEWNGVRQQGFSLPAMAPRNDAFWTESGNDPRLEADGRLICRVREYKYAQDLENVCFSYIKGSSREQIRRSFAEVLAFNGGHGGMVGSALLAEEPFADELARWTAFYRNWREELFCDTEDAAQVGVLRHERTLALDSGAPYRSAHLVEQLLLESATPFRLLVRQDWTTVLPRLRLLLLPDASCLESSEAMAVADFVRCGGGLVVIGDTSLRDAWYRLRPDYLLRDVLGPELPCPQPLLRSFQDAIFGMHDTRADRFPTLALRHHGRGRLVYAAQVQTPAAGQTATPASWRAPADAAPWLTALRWAAGPLAVEVTAPRGVLAEVRRRIHPPHGYRIHLVNLTPHPGERACAVSWLGPAPREEPGWCVRAFSPDAPPAELGVWPAAAAADGVSARWGTVVPALGTYTVLAVDPTEGGALRSGRHGSRADSPRGG
jgi:hypothetical protein